MLGANLQSRSDMRRASLISEIYSETAGPTGGNVVKPQQQQPKKNAIQAGAAKDADAAQVLQSLKGHPAFRPKRVTKSGLAKLCKLATKTNLCMHLLSNLPCFTI